jgi:hypothetical protein
MGGEGLGALGFLFRLRHLGGGQRFFVSFSFSLLLS